MSDWTGLAWLVVLLLGNAFFVAAEFAVISARRSQIEPLAAAGRRSARTALYAMEHATLMLATSQLGITVCSLLILNVSEPSIHHLLEEPLNLTGWTEEVIGTVAFVIALVLVSYLHVVFGEMVPKNISFSLPERAVLLLAPPLVFVSRVFAPITRGLNATANGFVRIFGVHPKSEAASTYTLDEVETIVRESTRSGTLLDSTGALSAAFEFTEKEARDVAVGIGSVVSLPEDATPEDVERAVARHGFSRYPLRDEDGELIGYVHIKDVLGLDDDDRYRMPIPAKLVRHLGAVLDETAIEDALATMRRGGGHLVRVVDHDGRTEGVLFLEDILEELVGEVDDATRRTGK